MKNLKKLIELVHLEHAYKCDSTSCNASQSMLDSYPLIAIDFYAGSGASSPEFDKLYGKGPSRKALKAEIDHLIKTVPLTVCLNCNAHHRDLDGQGIYNCDSCGKLKVES